MLTPVAYKALLASLGRLVGRESSLSHVDGRVCSFKSAGAASADLALLQSHLPGVGDS